MSSVEDSLAKTSQSQTEMQKGLMEVGLDYGLKCCESLAKYDQNTSLWRTHQLSLFEDLGESLENWPKQGMTQNGYAYAVQMWEGTITETESGFLPTPRASMGKPAKNRSGPESLEYRHNLEEFLGGKPNPTFCEWMMGWPMMWTSVTMPLEMDKFHLWQQQHSEFLEKNK
jgi:hypothetical protein